MKKKESPCHKFLWIALLLVSLSASSQTLLTKIKPKEAVAYTAYEANQKMQMMGDRTTNSGFTLGQQSNYLIAPEKIGMAVFDIGGNYDKLTFVMGPMVIASVRNRHPSIVVVYGDGRKLLDMKLYDYSIPQPYLLDVKGVKELKFDILTGEPYVGFGQVKLWTAAQKAVLPDFKMEPASAPVKLVKELKPYFADDRIIKVGPTQDEKTFKMNARAYDSGLILKMEMQIVGDDLGSAMFNLKKQFEKLSFLVGPVDNERNNEAGKGWITVKADGKIVYEKEMGQKDMAEQVMIDVTGVEMLSFHSEQTDWSLNAGFADITAYPAGMAPSLKSAPGMATATQAPADPKLAKLPDVCALLSNIEPYSILGTLDREQMLYTGKSDYITFSMGGVKYSEGMVFTSGSNVLHDNLVSSASFDLGNQFDYITFTAGFIGKSIHMKNDVINVYADDKLLCSVEIYATGIPTTHWVKIDKCRKLTFENKGGGGLFAGASGIADVVLYRGEVVENNLFNHPKPDCPEEVDLVKFAQPYIHYITTMNEDRDKIFYDGSTIRNYWTLRDGTRINNGFMLQTSIHFSIEHGVLSDDSNAMGAAAVGAAAVGASFVSSGIMVGGAMVGSTLAGVAPLLLLAAGGTAEESSCAAFNTWGEYNTVTFTVACLSPSSANLLEKGEFTNKQQRLLIGADHEIAAELLLNENMKPTSFTVPINACRQLMFWLPCDDESGKFIIYNAKLSKAKSELIRPASSIKSHATTTLFEWTEAPMPQAWKCPDPVGGKIDEYLKGVSQLYNGVVAQVNSNQGEPKHEFCTWYLHTANKQVCKATQVINNGGRNAVKDAKGVAAALGANFEPYNENMVSLAKSLGYDIENLNQLNSLVTSLRILYASAILELPNLGLAAIKYGKELTKAKQKVDECNAVVDVYLKNKNGQLAMIDWLMNNAVDIDGKKSTELTVFTPLRKGETPPSDEDLQLVETFDVK